MKQTITIDQIYDFTNQTCGFMVSLQDESEINVSVILADFNEKAQDQAEANQENVISLDELEDYFDLPYKL